MAEKLLTGTLSLNTNKISMDLHLSADIGVTHLNAKIYVNCVELLGASNVDQCPREISFHGPTPSYLIKVQKYTP